MSCPGGFPGIVEVYMGFLDVNVICSLISILNRPSDVSERGEILWLVFCVQTFFLTSSSPPCCRCLQHLKGVRSGCQGGRALQTVTLTLDLSLGRVMEVQVSLIQHCSLRVSESKSG